MVYATGMQTFFGRAAALLGGANQVGLKSPLPASLTPPVCLHVLPTCLSIACLSCLLQTLNAYMDTIINLCPFRFCLFLSSP